jgi:hypothetical protein
VQQRIEHPAALADQIEQAIGEAWHEQALERQRERWRHISGDRLDHRACDRRHVHRQPVAVEPLQQPGEPAHRPVADRHRAVPGWAM